MPRLAPAAVVARSALFTYLTPRLASDAALNYNALVQGVTSKNYNASKPNIVKAVQIATKGKLAQDADIMDLANLLDALSPSAGQADQEMMQTAPNSAAPPMAAPNNEGQDDNDPQDLIAKVKAYLEEQGVPPEILQNLDAFLAEPENPKPDVGDPATEQPAPAPEQPAPEGGGGGPPDGPPPKKEGEDEGLAGPTAITGLDNDLEDEVPSVDPVNKPAIVGSGETFGEATAEDEDEDEVKKPWEAEDGVIPSEQEGQVVTKTAMDAAIKQAQDRAIANQRNIRHAERFVRPWVGDLAMDAARPSDVYRATLKALGMDAKRVDKMHPDALVDVLQAQPRPTARLQRADRRMAADAAPKTSFLERFPDAGKITVQ